MLSDLLVRELDFKMTCVAILMTSHSDLGFCFRKVLTLQTSQKAFGGTSFPSHTLKIVVLPFWSSSLESMYKKEKFLTQIV